MVVVVRVSFLFVSVVVYVVCGALRPLRIFHKMERRLEKERDGDCGGAPMVHE